MVNFSDADHGDYSSGGGQAARLLRTSVAVNRPFNAAGKPPMLSNIIMPLKQCSDNLEFSRSLTNTIFAATRSPDEAFPPVRLCSEAIRAE
jgi:hypothetical protein